MHLLCAISHHGLGHLAQTAPVLRTLHGLRPGLEWTIWSGLSRQVLASRLPMPFQHRHEASDVGLEMRDALRVDAAGSLRALRAFHLDWDERIARESCWLRAQGFVGVLSNVGYLPLAAGRRAGLPTVAFCSLNWWDICRHYLGDFPETTPALAQMRAAYMDARVFLKLTPGMAMDWLPQATGMPPVAVLGQARPQELRRRLNIDDSRKLVVLGLGGVAYQPARPLPALAGVTWLVPDAWPGSGRTSLVGFGATGMDFPDILASSDALVTKVGYGSFVEAAALGLAVLYLDRPDWPETPWLATWLEQHARARAIPETRLCSPAIAEDLEELWRAPAPPRPRPAGAQACAHRILDALVLA